MSVGNQGVFNTDNHIIDKFVTLLVTSIGKASMVVHIGCELLITKGTQETQKFTKNCYKVWWITMGVSAVYV